MTRFTRPLLVCLLFLFVVAPAAIAQSQQSTDQGTVVSATRSTLLMRTDAGEYKLFELTDNTTRPKALPAGTVVKVTSTPTESGAPTANTVAVVTAAPPLAKGEKPPQPTEPVPASMRKMEKDIQRQVQRYRIGVRAGAALDPEQLLVGVHGQFGPFFSSNVFARPNLEFMFGEVTDIFALNLEAIYRVPDQRGKWKWYFGAGPAFNFVKKGFEDTTEDFSFSDFNFDAALNLIAGMQSAQTFLELKATAYGEPSIRFIVGYSF